MPSTTTARPRVDAGALGNAVFSEAVDALAETVVLTGNWLRDDDHPLTETQQLTLARSALLAASNLEARMTRTIVDVLDEAGVEVWGELTELLSREGGDGA